MPSCLPTPGRGAQDARPRDPCPPFRLTLRPRSQHGCPSSGSSSHLRCPPGELPRCCPSHFPTPSSDCLAAPWILFFMCSISLPLPRGQRFVSVCSLLTPLLGSARSSAQHWLTSGYMDLYTDIPTPIKMLKQIQHENRHTHIQIWAEYPTCSQNRLNSHRYPGVPFPPPMGPNPTSSSI